eukprot:81618-Rhodomonas_salina.3
MGKVGARYLLARTGRESPINHGSHAEKSSVVYRRSRELVAAYPTSVLRIAWSGTRQYYTSLPYAGPVPRIA